MFPFDDVIMIYIIIIIIYYRAFLPSINSDRKWQQRWPHSLVRWPEEIPLPGSGSKGCSSLIGWHRYLRASRNCYGCDFKFQDFCSGWSGASIDNEYSDVTSVSWGLNPTPRTPTPGCQPNPNPHSTYSTQPHPQNIIVCSSACYQS